MKTGFLLLAFLLASGPASPESAQSPALGNVNSMRAEVLATARTTWRRDAIITLITVEQGAPASGQKYPKLWVTFYLLSPSNRHQVWTTRAGGPADGVFNEQADAQDVAGQLAIGEFKVELLQALQAARRAGMNGDFTGFSLYVGHAHRMAPVLAWVITNRGTFFPVAVNANTGALLSWKQVREDPPGSDAQIAAAWEKFRRLNQPQENGVPFTCFEGIPTAEHMCLSVGGYVNPVTGKP